MAENQGGNPIEFPDLEALKRRFDRLRGGFGGGRTGGGPGAGDDGPRGPSRSRVGIIVGILLLVWLGFNSVFTVQPEEKGIILRLGRYLGPEHDAGPGLHFKLPLIDKTYILPVQRQLKQEFGFRTEEAGVRSTFVGVEGEATMLTGDENVAVVEWVVQYRISDAYQYLFKVRAVDEALRDLSEAVMRKVIGDRTVNEVVTVGRVEIERDAEEALQTLCDQYEMGVSIEEVLLQSNNPPEPVKPSFNDVNQAEQDRNKLLNEAQSRYNQVIPLADGQSRQTVEQAEGYATDRVNRARGDASRFGALYEEYRKAPEVTRTRMYLETLSRVLPAVGRKIVVDENVEGLIPMLNVDGERGAAAAAAEIQGGN